VQGQEISDPNSNTARMNGDTVPVTRYQPVFRLYVQGEVRLLIPMFRRDM